MQSLKSPKIIFSLVTGIFVVYAGVILFSIWPIDSKTIAQAGVFGDSFGVLTSLFSGLAFAGIILTIWQQQEELTITRDEIKTQQFENVLFKMLDIHNGILAEMDIRYLTSTQDHKKGDVVCTGRECFETFHKNLANAYVETVKKEPGRDDLSLINYAYEIVWEHHKRDLGHYFRFLYNIFKFIKSTNIEDKLIYSNIVRAQLSDYELSILFYNCLSLKGCEKFKPLIEEFHLLDNLPDVLLLDKTHRDMYAKTAYSNNWGQTTVSEPAR